MIKCRRSAGILAGIAVTSLVGSSVVSANGSNTNSYTEEQIKKILEESTKDFSGPWKYVAIVVICLFVIAICVEELRLARSRDQIKILNGTIEGIENAAKKAKEKAEKEFEKLQKENEKKIEELEWAKKKVDKEFEEIQKQNQNEIEDLEKKLKECSRDDRDFELKKRELEIKLQKERNKGDQIKASAQNFANVTNLIGTALKSGVDGAKIALEYTIGLPLKFKAGCIGAAAQTVSNIAHAAGFVLNPLNAVKNLFLGAGSGNKSSSNDALVLYNISNETVD